MRELDYDFICDHMVSTAIVDGKEVYWSDDRIADDEIPAGFIKYEVRGTDDDWTEWATIEKKVCVNFTATILSETEFELKPHPWFNPYTNSDGCDYFYEIEEYDLTEYEEDDLGMWEGGYSKRALKGYEIVTWPDSQVLMDYPQMRAFCYLINDDYGLDRFGESAYVVDEEWLKSL